jgi:3'(2'), 5'-bisphosphate nucleotidase
MNEPTRDYIDDLKKQHPDLDLISAGSSLKFCLVAEGKADQYPRFGPTMEWDTGAGHAIVLGAGKKVIVPETGSPLKYNKENLLNPDFLVC